MTSVRRRRLRILLTNVWLDRRGGTESVIRDVALGMLRRGHRPIVYSPHLGEMAQELYQRGVAVVDNLSRIAEAPDIIHGQHYVQTAECVFHFPETPIVQMCHAWQYWQEKPARFPNVRRYVAVDETVRDRLVHVESIEPTRVEIVLNGIDLARMPSRPASLPPKPATALAFTKFSAQLPLIEHACRRHGIRLDVLGQGGDRVVANPEAELVRYDLVFATARMAMEAAVAGCAVVICDSRGVAGMLRSGDIERLRPLNFGLRCLVQPVSAELIESEIGRYDAADAAKAAEILRTTADLELTLDDLERIYFQVLDEAQAAPLSEAEVHTAQMAFLNGSLPRRRSDGRWPWTIERENLQARVQALEKELADARAALLRTRNPERNA
jgi:hypothetical protein